MSSFEIMGLSKYYQQSRNAVVVQNIRDCLPFMQLHFQTGSGEIWIYRSDLFGFYNCDAFLQLYWGVIEMLSPNISAVKLLIPRDWVVAIDQVKGGSLWGIIDAHLSQLRRTAEIIEYCILEDALEDVCLLGDRQFDHFTSNECFVFYTSAGHGLDKSAICIHRLFLPEDKGIDVPDLRIVVVNSPTVAQHGVPPMRGLVTQSTSRKFEKVFSDGIGWSPFGDLVRAKVQEHGVSSSHKCKPARYPAPTPFLCYSHNDEAKDFAERLYLDLAREGIFCWKDTNSLAVGEEWRPEIAEAIEERGLLLVVLSREGIISAEMAKEIQIAKRCSAHFLPVSIADNDFLQEASANAEYDTYSELKDYQILYFPEAPESATAGAVPTYSLTPEGQSAYNECLGALINRLGTIGARIRAK